MKTLLHPRWLLLVHTLPLLLLGGIAWRQYTLISSLLDPAIQQQWLFFALGYLCLLAVGFTASMVLDARRQPTPLWVVFGLCFLTIAATATTLLYFDDLLPWDIPRWLRDDYLYFYPVTFAMPSLVYALLVGVMRTGPKPEEARAWKSFATALAIPGLAYVILQIVVPMRNIYLFPFIEQITLVSLVIGTIAFLFLLLRGCYILIARQRARLGTHRLIYLLPVSLLFPLLGLALNNGLLVDDFLMGDGVFGDFSHPLFYLLAVTNALYLCLPRIEHATYRLLVFLAGCAVFAYIVYFVLVFLPFLPLSVIAVLVAGTGLLMLTPLMLLPICLVTLYRDYRFLRKSVRPLVLRLGGGLAFLILPLAVTVSYLGDRQVLHAALDYVYAPSEVESLPLDHSAIERVLAAVRQQKGQGRPMGITGTTPYLSAYYQWLVLDNLTLSDDKIATLSAVFLGTPYENRSTDPPASSTATTLSSTTVNSKWDEQQQQWNSWLDLEIMGDSITFNLGEYETDIDLPPGLYIDDYYLYVGDRREHGILSERRAAVWVYNQIVGTNRDPGLLRYVAPDRVRLSVFPFADNELRRTGIRFIHREPVTITLEDRQITLGAPGQHPLTQPVTHHGVTYIPANHRGAGPQVQRKPVIQYILDGSRRAATDPATLSGQLDAVRSKIEATEAPGVISLAGTYPVVVKERSTLTAELAASLPGGFYAQRAMEHILKRAVEHPEETVPVMVVVGDDPILNDDFAAYLQGVPDLPYFYRYGSDGRLTEHPLIDPTGPGNEVDILRAPTTVYPYPSENDTWAYLTTDSTARVVVTGSSVSLPHDGGHLPDSWITGLALHGQQAAHRREGHTGYLPWLEEVRGSFRFGILMPTTAFLVVENEAQKEALRRKQQQVLESNPALDLEETRRMSEPGWWLFLLLLPLLYRLHRLSTRPTV